MSVGVVALVEGGEAGPPHSGGQSAGMDFCGHPGRTCKGGVRYAAANEADSTTAGWYMGFLVRYAATSVRTCPNLWRPHGMRTVGAGECGG